MNKRFALALPAVITVAAIVALLLALPSLMKALPLAASQQLDQAWRRASAVGQYAYQSTVVQTLHPTVRVENVGRTATVQRFTLTGQVDAPGDRLTLRIRKGDGNSRQFVDLKMEDGVAYGRVDEGAAWTELEEGADFFAPELFTERGDPMGFLTAAEHVRVLEAGEGEDLLFDQLLPREQGNEMTRYVFELDGLRYAEYLRERMEEALRRRGELAGGMHLELARAYLDMEGSGELWVNETGLPMRQIVRIELSPAVDAFTRKEVTITTDFTDWRTAPGDGLPRLWREPSLLVSEPNAVFGTMFLDQVQAATLKLSVLALLLLLTVLMMRHRRSPRPSRDAEPPPGSRV